MNGTEPAVDWTDNEAWLKLANAHGFIAILYGLGASLFGLALLATFGGRNGPDIWMAGLFLLLVLLVLAHLKTKSALEEGKEGAIAASAVLALPLLFGFPIGTIFAIYLFVQVARLSPPLPAQEDSEGGHEA